MKHTSALVFAIVHLAFFNGSLASAAEGAGGGVKGGKGVYCEQPDGSRKLMTLDYVRAESEWKETIAYVEGADEQEKALNMVKRITSLDPLRAARYEADILSFLHDPNWVYWSDDTSDNITEDSREYATCKNPKTVQVVIQYPMGVARKPWEPKQDFVVYRKRWNEMDADQRAGLIVHEVVLREQIAIMKPTDPTDPIMWFNAQIATNAVASLNRSAYYGLLKDTGLPLLFGGLFRDSMAERNTVLIQGRSEPWFFTDLSYSLVIAPATASQIKYQSARIYPIPFNGHFAVYEIPNFGRLAACMEKSFDLDAWKKLLGSMDSKHGVELELAMDSDERLGVCVRSKPVLRATEP